MKKQTTKHVDCNDVFEGRRKIKRKKNLPFLVNTTASMWRTVSNAVIAITEMTAGSALNSLIRFEISNPNSKRVQQRKDEFPFVVDMPERWKKLINSMGDLKVMPKSTKNQLSSGDVKA